MNTKQRVPSPISNIAIFIFTSVFFFFFVTSVWNIFLKDNIIRRKENKLSTLHSSAVHFSN